MTLKIPSDDRIEREVLALVREFGCVDNLTLLRSLLLQRLKEEDPEFRVSHTRLRKLVPGMEKVEFIVHAAESEDMTRRYGGEKALDHLKKCPVCGTRLNPLKNETLYGWVVVLEKKCPLCGYWTGRNLRRPNRYEVCIIKD